LDCDRLPRPGAALRPIQHTNVPLQPARVRRGVVNDRVLVLLPGDVVRVLVAPVAARRRLRRAQLGLSGAAPDLLEAHVEHDRDQRAARVLDHGRIVEGLVAPVTGATGCRVQPAVWFFWNYINNVLTLLVSLLYQNLIEIFASKKEKNLDFFILWGAELFF
jgi:hypothetical protein